MNNAIFAQIPAGTQEAVTALRPVVDHASQQGIAWYFAVLFFCVIGLLALVGWFGLKLFAFFAKSKVEADESAAKRYEELVARLRAVESEAAAAHSRSAQLTEDVQRMATDYAALQARSVRAMEDFTAAIRDLRSYMHPQAQFVPHPLMNPNQAPK